MEGRDEEDVEGADRRSGQEIIVTALGEQSMASSNAYYFADRVRLWIDRSSFMWNSIEAQLDRRLVIIM